LAIFLISISRHPDMLLPGYSRSFKGRETLLANLTHSTPSCLEP
jgi:hypothetical protein